MVPARSWAAGPAPGAGRWAGSVAWRGPGVAPRAPGRKAVAVGGGEVGRGEGACHLRPAERPLPRPRARAAPLPPRLPPSPRARAAVLPHAPGAGHRVRGTHERAVRAEQRENPLPHRRPAAAINVTRRDAPPPPPEKKKKNLGAGGGGEWGPGRPSAQAQGAARRCAGAAENPAPEVGRGGPRLRNVGGLGPAVRRRSPGGVARARARAASAPGARSRPPRRSAYGPAPPGCRSCAIRSRGSATWRPR
ncbi:unnamed protein product [Nyctereutes procyonoides]|uniref:(raccoon dog) hypothetical protein n=1 Tax=Nyctereutes procyonoides TaxID=34880 RepID=A0A811ZFN3_NYCPR|nr:unnamed protein product [Nyctereutes procyonoides]